MEGHIYKRLGEKSVPVPLARIIVALVLVLLAVFSFKTLADKYSSPDAYKHEIEQLDKRKEMTATMSIAAAVASAGVSAIPDDAGTPISEQLAEISRDLGLITGAIILEKYAMTILGTAVFRFILPIALLVLAGCTVAPRSFSMRIPCSMAVSRVLLASLVVWYSVPLGVRTSDMIFATYETTLNDAIETAQAAEELTAKEDSKEEPESGPTLSIEDLNIDSFWELIKGAQSAMASIPSAITGTVDSVVDSVGGKVSVLMAWARVLLTQMTEGFAVLAVTTCIIPILVPLFVFWILKLLFQPSTTMIPALPALPPRPNVGKAGKKSER